MKKHFNSKLIIVIFTAFIFIMGLLYVFMPKNNFSFAEKRFLAEFPEITWETIKDGTLSSEFEKYLADRVPFRKSFVAINSYFEYLKGNNGSNGVYLGKDGYLIEKPISENNKIEKNTSKIISFSEKTDIPVTLVVIPTKGFIYEDKLPSNSLSYNDDKYIDQISSLCNDKVNFINVTQVMKNNASDMQLYYRTDHHWTSDGAFVVYKEICKVLGFDSPNINNYSIEEYSGFYGTSYQTSLYTLTKPDNIKLYVNKSTNGKADIDIIEGSKVTTYNNMFFRNNLEEPASDIDKNDTNANTGDKYTVFLDGNHSIVKIKTGNSGGKLLLIKDSFAHTITPFLAENYSEIIMVDMRYYKMPISDLIESEGITDIMFLYSLDNLSSDNNLALLR